MIGAFNGQSNVATPPVVSRPRLAEFRSSKTWPQYSLGLNRRLHSPHQVKIKILTEFYETALVDKAWKLEGVGEGDERKLLERFSSVTAVFQCLPEGSRQVCNHRSRFSSCFVDVGAPWCNENRVCRVGRIAVLRHHCSIPPRKLCRYFEFSIACRATRTWGGLLHVHGGVRVDNSVCSVLARLLIRPPVV